MCVFNTYGDSHHNGGQHADQHWVIDHNQGGREEELHREGSLAWTDLDSDSAGSSGLVTQSGSQPDPWDVDLIVAFEPVSCILSLMQTFKTASCQLIRTC